MGERAGETLPYPTPPPAQRNLALIASDLPFQLLCLEKFNTTIVALSPDIKIIGSSQRNQDQAPRAVIKGSKCSRVSLGLEEGEKDTSQKKLRSLETTTIALLIPYLEERKAQVIPM